MKELILTFEDDKVAFVYDDELAEIGQALGTVVIERAGHVEPAPAGGWSADMGPSAGPVLGPFPLRGLALAAERDWLTQHRGL